MNIALVNRVFAWELLSLSCYNQQQHDLVIAHEAVDNGQNQTSLLSVRQMQHNNLQVDTTRRHMGGHQHIKDPSSGTILPKIFNRGMYRMANMANRLPTSCELQHLPRVTLTSVSKWNSQSNDDDNLLITDTAFSSKKVISGASCCQVFYGIDSHHIDIYSLRKECDGPEAFEYFVRQ
jgi:hypothetical protein